jgi:predicted DNA-binding protein with PD1-like motif
LTVHAFTVSKDEEVLETLQRAVTDAGIQHATVSLIGAVTGARVSIMKKDDALVDYIRAFDQPMELSGTGEVVDGKLHAHVTLYGEDGTFGGHLHSASVAEFFVHAYVTEVS